MKTKIKAMIAEIEKVVNDADKTLYDYASICLGCTDNILAFEEFKASIFSVSFTYKNTKFECVLDLTNTQAGISMLKKLRKPFDTFKEHVRVDNPIGMAWSYYNFVFAIKSVRASMQKAINEVKTHFKDNNNKIMPTCDNDDNYLPQYVDQLTNICKLIINSFPNDFSNPIRTATSKMLELIDDKITEEKIIHEMQSLIVKHSNYIQSVLDDFDLTEDQNVLVSSLGSRLIEVYDMAENLENGNATLKEESLFACICATYQINYIVEEVKITRLNNLKRKNLDGDSETQHQKEVLQEENLISLAEDTQPTLQDVTPESATSLNEEGEEELTSSETAELLEDEEEQLDFSYKPYAKPFTPAMTAKVESEKANLFSKIKFSSSNLKTLRSVFNLEDRTLQFKDLENLFIEGFKSLDGQVIMRGGSKRTLRINQVDIHTLDNSHKSPPVIIKMHQIHGRDNKFMPKSFLIPIRNELIRLGLNQKFFSQIEATKAAASRATAPEDCTNKLKLGLH